jgi:hypothetical protein
MSTNNEDEYLAHVISLAKEAANRGGSFTVPSKEEWMHEKKEYEAYLERLIRDNVNQGVVTLILPTKQEWYFNKQTEAATNLQLIAPISTTSTDVLNAYKPIADVNEATSAQFVSSAVISTSPSTAPNQLPSIFDDSSRQDNSKQKIYADENEQLIQHFLKLFKLYSVTNSTTRIIEPLHLTVKCLQEIKTSIETEVYTIIKECDQVTDPDTKQIVMASIDYQDYQRSCSITTDCQCQERYRKPHFFFSMNPITHSADEVDKMSPHERSKARERGRVKTIVPVINYDKNLVRFKHIEAHMC